MLNISTQRATIVCTMVFAFAEAACAAAIEHYSLSRAAEETKTATGWSAVTTTPASIPGSSFTVGKKYLLLCWGYHNNSNANSQAGIRVTHGGTPFPESETTEESDRTAAQYKRAYFWFTVWTAANEDLQVEYFCSGNTARVQDITLIAIYAEDLIANGDMVYDIQTGGGTLTTAYTAKAGISWTPDFNNDVWWLGGYTRFDIGDTNTSCLGRLNVNGNIRGAYAVEGEDTNDTPVYIPGYVEALPDSSLTVSHEIAKSTAGSSHTWLACGVFALRLNTFLQHTYTAAPGNQVLDAGSGIWKTVGSTSVTPSLAGDWLTIGGMSFDDNNGRCQGRIQLNGASITSELGGWQVNTNDYAPYAMADIQSFDTNIKNLTIDGRETSDVTPDPEVVDVYLASFSMELALDRRYWIGGSGNWSDTSHWAYVSGASIGGASVPSSQQLAIFDANSGSGTCTIDAAINVRGLLHKGANITIAQGGNSMQIGTASFAQRDGIFTGGSAAMDVQGDYKLSGGTFTAPGATLAIGGDYSHSGGAFSHNNGTVAFNGSAGQTIKGSSSTAFYTLARNAAAAGQTLTIGDPTAAGLTISANSFSWTDNNDTVIVGNGQTVSFAIASSGLTIPEGCTLSTTSLGVIELSGGDWTNNGTYTANDGTVRFNSGASQSVAGNNSTTFGSLAVVNNTSLAITTSATVSGALNVDSGASINVAAGKTLTASASSTLDGSLALQGSGSALALGNGATVSMSSTSSFVAQPGSRLETPAGYGTLSLAGSVSLAGAAGTTTDNAINVYNTSLTLASSGGTASYVRMSGISDTGPYVTISGAGWDGSTLDGWAFADTGTPGLRTVRIDISGGRVLMKGYETNSGYIYGEDTDIDEGEAGSAGKVMWAPTPAVLTHFSAVNAAEGIRVRWRTACEFDHAGFFLWRREMKISSKPPFIVSDAERGWRLVIPRLVRGEPSAIFGHEYEVLDTNVRRNGIYAYRLEEVNLWGARSCLQPPVVTQAHGIKANHSPNKGMPAIIVRGYEGSDPGSAGSWRQERFISAARQWSGYGGILARIETEAEGLVRIPQADLAAIGFSPQGRFVLFSQGRSVECWSVSTDGQSRDLCFYAPAYRTLYSRKNIFWLGQTAADGLPLLVDSAVVSAAAPGNAITDYEAVSRCEEDKIYAGNLPNSSPDEDHFFCAGYLAAGRSLSRTLYCADVISSRPAKARLMLRSYSPTSPSSHVQVLVNDFPVGEFAWNGACRYLVEAVVPAGVLRDGANVVTLRSYGDTGAVLEITYTDWVEIAYRRPLRMVDGRLRFKCDSPTPRAMVVSGISSPRVMLVEVMAQNAKRIQPVKLRRAKSGYEAIFQGKPGAVYFLAETAAISKPIEMELTTRPRALASRQCDYLVICLDNLAAVAEEFAFWRRSQGLHAEVFTLSETMDAANWGLYDPRAIINLLQTLQPRYVLILGDMTYDYFGVHGSDALYAVPAPFVIVQDFHTVSDYPYGQPGQRSVGRIPARTPEEALIVLRKSQAREAAVERQIDMIVAADSSMAHFALSCEEAAAQALGPVARVYVSRLGIAAAREALVANWNLNPRIVYFSGHGSNAQWGEQNLFHMSQVPALAPQAAPPLAVMLNCLSAAVPWPHRGGYGSLAEALLFAPERGASAVLGSNALTPPKGQSRLGNAFLRGLRAGQTLGQAFGAAQQDCLRAGEDPDVLRSFLLLGDPAGR